MLTIRMQRTGRRGHAQFRVVLQDSRTAPSSGRVIARLGSYDPHTKVATLDKEKISFYLQNGAHPSDRAVKLFSAEKIALPEWVKVPATKESAIKNTDKLRRNQPKEEAAKEEPEAAVEETVEAEAPAEA